MSEQNNYLSFSYCNEKETYLYLPGYLEKLSSPWELLLGLGEKKAIKKGGEITTDNAIFYIFSGLIKKTTREHNHRNILYIGRQCLIGETDFLRGYSSSSAYVCVHDSIVYRFPYHILKDVLSKKTSAALFENLRFSPRKKKDSENKLREIRQSLSSVRGIAVFLYGCYLHAGEKTEMHPPLSQKIIADLLGIQTNTIARIIGTWKKHGIITEWNEKRLEIADIGNIRDIILTR